MIQFEKIDKVIENIVSVMEKRGHSFQEILELFSDEELRNVLHELETTCLCGNGLEEGDEEIGLCKSCQ